MKNKNVLMWLWLAFATISAASILTLYAHDPRTEVEQYTVAPQLLPAPHAPTAQHSQAKAVKHGGQLIHVTAFSSFECHTTWCRSGQPRGQKVAVNKRFGKVSKVYIPVFNKTYVNIGSTDGNTDLDIWFGDEHDSALSFGSKYLRVIFYE